VGGGFAGLRWGNVWRGREATLRGREATRSQEWPPYERPALLFQEKAEKFGVGLCFPALFSALYFESVV
jgi:hypothetical protein